ncbi:hypothetical protein L4C36_00300 [Photobacterium japonica]|uniref:hypothetical protein n=1 Tax=Photobacterium japonica TaxID=2910235 RepID=UPI003D131105
MEENTEKKRGFLLTTFLILMMVVNPLSAFSYFFNAEMILTIFPNMPLWIIYLLGGMCVFNVILAIGVWMWKKPAIYGFYAVVMFAFLINLYMGVELISSLSGLIGGVVLFFATKKKMAYFN